MWWIIGVGIWLACGILAIYLDQKSDGETMREVEIIQLLCFPLMGLFILIAVAVSEFGDYQPFKRRL